MMIRVGILEAPLIKRMVGRMHQPAKMTRGCVLRGHPAHLRSHCSSDARQTGPASVSNATTSWILSQGSGKGAPPGDIGLKTDQYLGFKHLELGEQAAIPQEFISSVCRAQESMLLAPIKHTPSRNSSPRAIPLPQW
jgi:hypothetical protein